ncbi:hypothetical protein C1H46_043855 [Malus baccata]|uniref:Uncharacterized protein n=1 Tax=Malus baccata TaxID=106549 RepID=A0A540K9K1_MALBA|nr:hypothetical protein C1H46_043855 [Malus baccata]
MAAPPSNSLLPVSCQSRCQRQLVTSPRLPAPTDLSPSSSHAAQGQLLALSSVSFLLFKAAKGSPSISPRVTPPLTSPAPTYLPPFSPCCKDSPLLSSALLPLFFIFFLSFSAAKAASCLFYFIPPPKQLSTILLSRS